MVLKLHTQIQAFVISVDPSALLKHCYPVLSTSDPTMATVKRKNQTYQQTPDNFQFSGLFTYLQNINVKSGQNQGF